MKRKHNCNISFFFSISYSDKASSTLIQLLWLHRKVLLTKPERINVNNHCVLTAVCQKAIHGVNYQLSKHYKGFVCFNYTYRLLVIALFDDFKHIISICHCLCPSFYPYRVIDEVSYSNTSREKQTNIIDW